MTGADETLARIDEVLGFADDMSIEWDHSMSADAMRSRPIDLSRREPNDGDARHIVLGFDGTDRWVLVDAGGYVVDEYQASTLGQMQQLDPSRLLAVLPRRTSDMYSFDRRGEQ